MPRICLDLGDKLHARAMAIVTRKRRTWTRPHKLAQLVRDAVESYVTLEENASVLLEQNASVRRSRSASE